MKLIKYTPHAQGHITTQTVNRATQEIHQAYLYLTRTISTKTMKHSSVVKNCERNSLHKLLNMHLAILVTKHYTN